MKTLLVFSIAVLATLISTASFANPPAGVGGGKGHGNPGLNSVVGGSTPPGLQKKGFTPRGLQNKTPHGWNQGRKAGWDKNRVP